MPSAPMVGGCPLTSTERVTLIYSLSCRILNRFTAYNNQTGFRDEVARLSVGPRLRPALDDKQICW